jgi:DNA-binding transcriptional ArsR family regulator
MSASRLGKAFSALSDPTRRAILASLATGEKTVLELCKPFPMSQPAISRHLRVLEESGLITRRIDGAKRPCRLAPNAMQDVEQWLEMFRGALEANYERLDALLAENSSSPSPPNKAKK